MSGESDEESRSESNRKYLNDFLGELGVSLACPRCGTTSWWAMGTRENPKTFRLVGVHHLEVYAAACKNCGLIQEHVSDIVEGKVGKNDD